MSLCFTKKEVLNDYETIFKSRQASIIGKKEVFAGRAKFGVFGDGKELPQVVLSKFFENGDYRAGYYRDQTFAFATGEVSIAEYFSQLYAHPDVAFDPSSGGRTMNSHFASRLLDSKGDWRSLVDRKNITADISSICGQMPRLIGLGYASKLYRNHPSMLVNKSFSSNGREVIFGGVGNGGCAEGIFWETVNTFCLLQLPVVLCIWDDNYAISVDNSFQVAGGCVSSLLKGFSEQKTCNVYQVPGWDYPKLHHTYKEAINCTREKHIPSILHITELTQPLGHSTSGSHERYKSKEVLDWEKEHDNLKMFKKWIIENQFATLEELEEIEKRTTQEVKKIKKNMWEKYQKEVYTFKDSLKKEVKDVKDTEEVSKLIQEVDEKKNIVFSDVYSAARKILFNLREHPFNSKKKVIQWISKAKEKMQAKYDSYLYSESSHAALLVKPVKPIYSYPEKQVYGFEILNKMFDAILDKYPQLFIIGQDVGKLGDVNQGLLNMQKKYGEWRVTDTGIRETTQIGQAVGAAMRGLKPIVEIQYLDYIYYGLIPLADELSTLLYRTAGGQKAPIIIRTRGHRLVGIWHSGSPMSMLLGALRGIYLITPRNMTQAAGFYNTMLQSDDSALIIETLNAYRVKERVVENIGGFCLPLGVPEILNTGTDITIVTYGAMCSIVVSASKILKEVGISCEVIDVQTLLPFDIKHSIVSSIKKTNRVLFTDEDVPGGATAYMMQKVLDEQNAYTYLDSVPKCLSAKEHRCSYGDDGTYFSKPSIDDVVEYVYEILQEAKPKTLPSLYL